MQRKQNTKNSEILKLAKCISDANVKLAKSSAQFEFSSTLNKLGQLAPFNF